MIPRSLFHFYCLFYFTAFYGQEPVFKQFGVAEGLPAREVYNLYQDREGYVWVFTEYGIVKHNGSRFIPVCNNIPFNESIGYDIVESPSGDPFFLNSRGKVYLLKNDSAFLVKGMETLSADLMARDRIPMDLYIDNFNTIWLSVNEQSYSIFAENYTIDGCTLPIDKRIPKTRNSEYNFHFERIDSVPNVIFKLLNSNSVVQEYHHSHARNEFPRAYARNHKNNLYLGIFDTLQLFNNGTLLKAIKLESGMISMEIDSESHIWVSLATGGICEFDQNLNLVGEYLKEKTIHDILFDSKGGIWLGTLDEGVFYCADRGIKSYATVGGLGESIKLLKVANDKLFIATKKGQLYVKENGILHRIDKNNEFSQTRDVTYFEDKYYITTNPIVFKLDRNLETIGVVTELSGIYSTVVYKNTLICYTGSVIYKKQEGKKQFTKQTRDLGRILFFNRFDKELLGYSRNGMYSASNNLFVAKCLSAWEEKNICKLKTDKRENIWVCTKGDGLYCLTINNRKIKYSNVPSKVINSIGFMNDTVVLLATNKGAYASTLRNINVPGSWILLLDEEVVDIELFENRIYLATKSGLVEIDPKSIFKTVHHPLYLKSIVCDGEKIPLGTKQFSYYQDELFFDFDVLAFGLPIKLAYRLNGPSKFLGTVDGTQLHLQNLAPGKYTLYVYALTNESKNKVFKYEFYIQPAFWQTGWFKWLIVLTVIGSSAFIFYRLVEKKRRTLQIEKQLTEYRLTALKSQVNPHFMSNSLVAIQRLILKNEMQTANRYLVKFSLLIRYLLDYSDKSATTLESELNLIDLYVELEQLRFSNRFTFQKVIDPTLDLTNFYIPTLITQPLIENAIWHGLLGLSGERKPELILEISVEENVLLLVITDNGVGRGSKHTAVSTPLKKSKGVELIMNRITSLNRLYKTTETRVEYIDLTDENGLPLGTSVTIVFPLELLNILQREEDEKCYY